MAFKMKNAGGSFKTMGSSPSPMKAKASNEVWNKANEASKEQNSGTSLNDLVAKRKTLEKGSNDYNTNQNAINKAMGNSKRHDTTTSSDNKIGGGSKEVKTSDNGKVVTTTSKRADDTKKKESIATNTSTYDANTGKGSSGKGVVTVDNKYKADGETLKRRSTSTADMGTDEKSDDIKGSTSRGGRRTKTRSRDPNTGKVTTTKEFHKGKKAGTSQVKEREVGKIKGKVPISTTNRSTYDPKTGKGSSGLGMETVTGNKKGNKRTTTHSMGTDTKKDDKVTKTKIGKNKQTTKRTNADLHSGGVGTSKTKEYTRGKKAGTSETKERQKGKLFGKKVEVDYS